jgi:hypothetical protein
LNIIQLHDENYALWIQFSRTGSYDNQRFNKLLETIKNCDLFLMFLIIDGCTRGKEPSKLAWFVNEVRKYEKSVVDELFCTHSLRRGNMLFPNPSKPPTAIPMPVINPITL